MKKIFVSLLFIFLIMGSVSALEFDNVKIYDEETREVTIVNAFNIPLLRKDLAKIRLLSDLEVHVIAGEDRQVAEFIFNNIDGPYDNAFTNMEFFTAYTDTVIDKEFTYKYKHTAGYETVFYHDESKCTPARNPSGSAYADCTGVERDSYQRPIIRWIPLSPAVLARLPQGNLTIGVFADVEVGESVEWIPSFMGVRIEEWAVWTEALNDDLLVYYTLNETSGERANSVNGSINNASQVSTNNYEASSKIGGGLVSNGAGLLDAGGIIANQSNLTMAYWFKKDDGTNTNNGWVGGAEEWRHNYNNCAQSSPSLIGMTINNQCHNIAGSSDPSGQDWQHLAISVNGHTGNRSYYINGTLMDSFGGNTFTDLNIGFVLMGYTLGNPTQGTSFHMDEFGLWTRILTDAEVSQLYNNGTGITFQPVTNPAPDITLNHPDDNAIFNVSPIGIHFNATVTDDKNLTNVSLYINGAANFSTNPGVNETEVFQNVTFTDGIYTWLVNASDDEDGNSSSSTRTFTVDSTAPVVTITRPTGTFNYVVNGSNSTLVLEYNVADLANQTCYFEYPAGTNTTITCNNQNNISIEAFSDDSLNVFANDTAGNLGNATANWEYIIFQSDQQFNSTTIETSTEGFSIDIVVDTSIYTIVSAQLNYNGTTSAATSSQTGNNFTFTASRSVPAGVGTQPFFWNVSLTNTTGNFFFESPTNNQTVNEFLVGDCSATTNTPILNFTSAREDNLTEINPFLFEATFEFFIGDGSEIKNITVAQASVPSKAICIGGDNSTSVTTTGQVKYDGTTPGDFVARDYFFEEDVFNNQTTNITLYLLDAADSTSFIQIVQDQNIIRINDALIFIERFYPGLNEFRVVQVSRTDDDGQSVGFYEIETVDYRHTIKKDTETLLVTTPQKIIGGETPFTLTFTIGEITTDPLNTFEGIDDLDATLVFNDSTEIVTFTYADTSGNFSSANLLVELVAYNSANTQICNQNSTSASGVITCNVAGQNGTFVAQGFISRSPGQLAIAIQFVISSSVGIFGTTGLFLAWFIILAAAMTGIWNPTVGIILTNMAVILVNIIGLATFAPIFIFGLVGVSLILVILLKT